MITFDESSVIDTDITVTKIDDYLFEYLRHFEAIFENIYPSVQGQGKCQVPFKKAVIVPLEKICG
jgi:hypothetical protein